jgi:hypothetical protein
MQFSLGARVVFPSRFEREHPIRRPGDLPETYLALDTVKRMNNKHPDRV